MSRWYDSDYRIALAGAIHESGISIETIAHRLGISGSALYKYLEGINVPAPELFPAIYNITKQDKIIGWFVDQCDNLRLVRNGHHTCDGDIRDEIEQLTAQIGRVIDRRRAAYCDGRCTEYEKRQIIESCKAALDAAQSLYEDAKNVKTDD